MRLDPDYMNDIELKRFNKEIGCLIDFIDNTNNWPKVAKENPERVLTILDGVRDLVSKYKLKNESIINDSILWISNFIFQNADNEFLMAKLKELK